jgi:hypothetical protein
VLALAWDAKGPYDVVVQTDAGRGSVVNGVADAEAIDPSVQRVRLLKQYRYQTDTIVLDIYGGFKLKGSDELTAPGYMLVMGPHGELQLRGEMEDRPRYEESFIPPEKDELRSPNPVEGKAEEGSRFDEPESGQLEEPAESGRESPRPLRVRRTRPGSRRESARSAAPNANR